MARMRMVKPSFFLNETLADVPPLGRLLFAGLWCLADRAGRLEDRPKRIKAEVLPYDDCDVDALLTVLHTHGFILRYAIADASGEHQFIQVLTFAKHQSPHMREAPSTIPAPCEHDTSTVLGTSLSIVKSLDKPNSESLTEHIPLPREHPVTVAPHDDDHEEITQATAEQTPQFQQFVRSILATFNVTGASATTVRQYGDAIAEFYKVNPDKVRGEALRASEWMRDKGKRKTLTPGWLYKWLNNAFNSPPPSPNGTPMPGTEASPNGTYRRPPEELAACAAAEEARSRAAGLAKRAILAQQATRRALSG